LKDLELLELVKLHEESSDHLSDRKLVFHESLLRKHARGKYVAEEAVAMMHRFAEDVCADYLLASGVELDRESVDELCSDLSFLLESEFEYDLRSGALAWMIADCRLESRLTSNGEPRRRKNDRR
jgi:hypothetical protein